MAAALAHPSVSMVSPPGPSTSYCVTMSSPTTSHPFISSEESSEDEFCITPTFHTIQGHGHGQRRKLPRCQHRPRNTGRSRGRARSRSRGMGGRRGGHASLSAAGSSASALGPSSVRSTGVDVPVGAWKRTEPSSICHVYTETPGPTSILVISESTPLQIKHLPCIHRNPWTYVHISYIREYSSPNQAFAMCIQKPWTYVHISYIREYSSPNQAFAMCTQKPLDLRPY